jgi:hypothetical protein
MERNLILKETSSLAFGDKLNDREIKTVSVRNTDLDAPYMGGNFDFSFDGDYKATVTFNTYYKFASGINDTDKLDFKRKMKIAAECWDLAAAMYIMDKHGNFSKLIVFKFVLNEVADKKKANKVTDVYKSGQNTFLIGTKDTGVVVRDVNVPIHFEVKELAHELGHVWGLLDQYDRPGKWVGHVGRTSPLRKDTLSLMHDGDEFRPWFFSHIGKEVLKAFRNEDLYKKPIKSDEKVIGHVILGRIKLWKKNIGGDKPYGTSQPHNPLYTAVQEFIR